MDRAQRKPIMAKGQKRSNRETRKPKASKPPAASAAALSTKGMLIGPAFQKEELRRALRLS